MRSVSVSAPRSLAARSSKLLDTMARLCGTFNILNSLDKFQTKTTVERHANLPATMPFTAWLHPFLEPGNDTLAEHMDAPESESSTMLEESTISSFHPRNREYRRPNKRESCNPLPHCWTSASSLFIDFPYATTKKVSYLPNATSIPVQTDATRWPPC